MKIPRPWISAWLSKLVSSSLSHSASLLSQTQRGCQKPQLFSVPASLVLGSSFREEVLEQWSECVLEVLRRDLESNGDWASAAPFSGFFLRRWCAPWKKVGGTTSSQPRRFLARNNFWLEQDFKVRYHACKCKWLQSHTKDVETKQWYFFFVHFWTIW